MLVTDRDGDGERQVAAGDDPRQVLTRRFVSGEHDLLHARQRGRQRGGHHRHGAADLLEAGTEQLQRSFDALGPLRIVDQMRERQQVQHRHRARGRLGPVVVLFHPQEHASIAAGRAEPSTVRLIPEQLILPALQRHGPFEPPGIAVGLEQFEQPENQVGVVFGVAVNLGVAGAKPPEQGPGVRKPHAIANK